MKISKNIDQIELTIEVAGWSDEIVDLANLLEQCLTQTLRTIDKPLPGTVSVLLSHDERMRGLNRTFRKIDRPTNVLSFPSPKFPGGPLGDVALGFETCSQQARDRDISLATHLCHLFVHGVLHLLGYEHSEASSAAQMEQLESTILTALGQNDPWKDEDGNEC
ncbi:MAG: rRNA maturation RNase YbeY [Robiginitomaculum sp.]|nr:MAG: rRNA maturation RNase YbeY [Robiginitomaculum sp.]